MSHVIGQGTIASNHYRTSEYRASQYETPQVFNSETLEFNSQATRQIRTKVLQTVKDKLIPAMRGYSGTGAQAKKWAKATDAEFDVAIKKILDLDNFDELVGDGVTKKEWLKKLINGDVDGRDLNNIAKSLSGDNLAKKLDKDSLGAAADSLQEGIQGSAFSPRQKTLLKYTTGTTVGLTTIGMLIFGPGSDVLNKWANYTTGLDCPEKAVGRGFEEDTPEYAEAVKTCQEGTMESLMRLGYGALAIIGFVGIVAVTRAIPKKKAPKEDSEDEE